MTTIILTIVGILLAAAAALMVLWFGGESFNTGAERAVASTQFENMQQIAHAYMMYEAEHGIGPEHIGVLVNDRYLASVPEPATGRANYIVVPIGARPYVLIGAQTKRDCEAFNRVAFKEQHVLTDDFDGNVKALCYGSRVDEYFMALRI